jgi:uncharacterized membrane protein (DUF4010 family)
MEPLELFQRLSVALAIGMLIGLERGWQARDDSEGGRAAGFRTHALGGLLGGIWGALAVRIGDAGIVALSLAFMTYSSAVIIFRYRETQHDGTFGMTTVVAAMLTFALGAFAVLGDMRAAAASGVAVTGLLALKSALHTWIKRLSWVELRSALVLMAMTFIMLPLLPNRMIDPWEAVNPYEIWLMTILIAAISFTGYGAIKLLGAERGVLFGAICGGLASSTATTLTMARLAAENPQRRDTLIGGILIAGATMVARVLAIVALLNTGVMQQLALPLGLSGATLAAAGWYLIQRGSEGASHGKTVTLANPFDLDTVLKFGTLLMAVSVFAKIATSAAGDFGAYAIAALSGIADVDAITLSMSRLGGGPLTVNVAALAIAIALAVNTGAKAALGWSAGGPEVGKRLAVISAAAVATGLAGLLLRGAI